MTRSAILLTFLLGMATTLCAVYCVQTPTTTAPQYGNKRPPSNMPSKTYDDDDDNIGPMDGSGPIIFPSHQSPIMSLLPTPTPPTRRPAASGNRLSVADWNGGGEQQPATNLVDMSADVTDAASETNETVERSQIAPSRGQPSGNPVLDFVWTVFGQARTARRLENMVCSPLLLQQTLALVQTAAAGETYAQLERVVQRQRPEQLHQLGRQSMALAAAPGSANRLRMAAAIFADEAFGLATPFVSRAQQQDVLVTAVNFANADQTAQTINGWVANATANKIRQLFRADQLGDQSVLLTNAMYFSGVWRNAFNDTEAGKFHMDYRRQKNAVFMRSEHLLRIKEFQTIGGEKGTWVEIPYKGNEFSMIVIVPEKRFGLDRLIHDMGGSDIADIFDQLRLSYRRQVDLRMPKFEIETSISLVNTLLKMGLTDLFTINARLPHLTSAHQQVKIDDILQRAVLKVDEKGSEAAVVQSVNVVTLSISDPPPKAELNVDQPFVAMIVDRVNRVPLFVAKIVDPAVHEPMMPPAV